MPTAAEQTKTQQTYEVWYWLEGGIGAPENYIIWATGLAEGVAHDLAYGMRQRRPRNAFTVQATK